MPTDPAALDQIVQDLLPIGALDADGPMYASDWNALVRAVALVAIQLGAAPVEFPAPGAVPRPPAPPDPGRTVLARLADLDERMARLERGIGATPAGSGEDDEMSDIVSDARLDAIEAETAGLTTALDGLASKLDARLRALEDRLGKHVTTMEEQLAALTKGLERLGAEAKDHASAAEVEKRLTSIEASLLKLSGQVGSGSGTSSPDISIFKDRFDLFEKAVGVKLQTLDLSVESQRSKFEDVESQLKRSDSLLASAGADLVAVKTDMSSMKTGLSSALESAATASTTASGLSSKLTDLQKTVNLSTSSLEAIKTSLSSATTRIGTVETKVGTVESTLGTVQSKIGTVETKISSFEALDLTTRLGALETDTTSITKALEANRLTIPR